MTIAGLRNASLHMQETYIGGQWRQANSSKTLTVLNPSTGAMVGTIPDCDATDAREAINVAVTAGGSWRARTAADRAELLERWHKLILESEDDLGRIMTAEQGKPLAEAVGEVRYAASFVKWFAEEARRIGAKGVPAPQADRRILITKEPIGVSAAITPWNFPSAMITRKVAPALAAGCPIIIKPSELTPFSALALVKLAQQAGFPSGVVNIVTGRPEAIGNELTSNAAVRMISFTGSTRVGALLMRQSADTIKRLGLELGGNAPLLVFDDADIDVAVSSTMASKFRNAGQTCVCANRILVQDAVFDEFAARLAKEVIKLRVGDGFSPGTTIGPLINAAAVAKTSAHLSDALSKGATPYVTAENSMDQARFATPTILTGATPAMRLAVEETFGPIAPLFRFKHEEEAIELANDTPYGLASYFFTENIHRAFRVAERLEFGIVGLNTGVISMEVAPFGGIKQSGLGREGGEAGIDEFLETKVLHVGNLQMG